MVRKLFLDLMKADMSGDCRNKRQKERTICVGNLKPIFFAIIDNRVIDTLRYTNLGFGKVKY